ncbi:hypothetical protein SAMN05216326_1321 [Nitrosomonas marina]|uniref:Uncharacterized protein n=1 Tax=Nitrosomonas marina TaxID=917 RepID=A0A1I0F0J0_9PROT|nr:hypothetical protein [Nitrosomonas marina]SET51293.1 hypothetical protein SAMN05216326_1321 [Nitrosomonas marina]
MSTSSFHKHLSAPGLIKEVRACFERIEDNGNGKGFSLIDCLMSGFAVFSLILLCQITQKPLFA